MSLQIHPGRSVALLLCILIFGCDPTSRNYQKILLTDIIPDGTPLTFGRNLTPEGKIIHRGVFNPDFSEYYMTVSDTAFAVFDILVSRRAGDHWSDPAPSAVNSEFSDHGMSFSPDGKELWFSSTRPVAADDSTGLWRIWKSNRAGSSWTTPQHIPIAGLENRSVSHPSLTKGRQLYFHSSLADYTDMHMYSAKPVDGSYSQATMLSPEAPEEIGTTTPFVSADGRYLFYATISPDYRLTLNYLVKMTDGTWSEPNSLPEEIQTNNMGNPYLLPDNNFLFFPVEVSDDHWEINWVNISSQLKDEIGVSTQ